MNAYSTILQNHPILSCLSGRALSRLIEVSQARTYHKGDCIVQEGDPCTSLYLILSGRCQASALRPDGRPRIQRTLAHGDLFGERALLSLDTFWFTVTVLSDCTVLEMPVEDLRKELARNRRLQDALQGHMFSRLRASNPVREPDAHRRIAVFASLSGLSGGVAIAQRVATIIRQDTRRSVLFIRIVSDEKAQLQLSQWEDFKARLHAGNQVGDLARKETSGVWCMDIGVSSEGRDAESVSALLGYVSRHVRYVVLHVAANVAAGIVTEALVQADSPYVLMTQSDEDVYRGHLLVRRLGAHPRGQQIVPRPVICLSGDERAQSYETLQSRLGVKVHEYIHSLPKHISGVADITNVRSQERAYRQLRYLAHEIGHCRVGLALAAGGAKGLAHIGVIQVLEEQGIEIDMIAGTSIGGLIGSLWAYGLSGDAMERIARRNMSIGGMLRLIDPVFPPRRGFIKGGIVPRIVHDAMGDVHFSDLNRQLRVTATDLDTLERVVFSSGQVGPVVHASMAMPGVVVPVRLNGRTLVDGGVSDPIPVDVLRERGIEHVIAVNTIPNPDDIKSCMLIDSETQRARRRRGTEVLNHYANYFHRGNILDIWVKSMQGLESRVAEVACRRADVVLRPTSCGGRWHDFSHPGKYIALGRRVAEMQLEQIRELAA